MSSDTLRFGECASLVRASTSPSLFPDAPYIALEHIDQGSLSLNGHAFGRDADSQKTAFKEGDILFGKLRPYFRKVIIAPFDGLCSTDIWAVRPKSGIDRNFLFYWMASEDFVNRATDTSEGTRMPRAKWDIVSKFEIPNRNLEEQIEIGKSLRALDDRIALLREINATLEAIAQAMFKSWFVDFDPVHANAKGRDSPQGGRRGLYGPDGPTTALPEGMSEATPARSTPVGAPGVPPDPSAAAALFPDSFEESELGLVPRGWGTSAVYDLAQYINGAAYKAFEPNPEQRGLPIIKIAELKAGVTKQTGYSDVSMPEKYRIAAGDILFSWSGNPDTSIDTFVWLHGNAWLNQHIFRVVPHISSERSFVLMTLKYLNPIFAEAARNKQTTGLGHVTVADLKRLRVVKPSDAVLQQWNEIVDPLIERAFNVAQQAQTLATLRDTLLPRLISGQLRLPQAEAALEEVAA